MTEQEILDVLMVDEPFLGLTAVRVTNLVFKPTISPVVKNGKLIPDKWRIRAGPDVSFELEFAQNSVTVYGKVMNACTPKLAQQIASWLASLKALKRDAAFALICSAMSPQAQAICDENNVDFIDLAGNISINVPGKFLLRRTGLRSKTPRPPSPYPDPFSPASSRVVRVLLQKPDAWTVTQIARELTLESGANQLGVRNFAISIPQVSKTVRSLEEELLIRRRDSAILVPDPRRLLFTWAAKYKERYRWYLRSSFKCSNPFGTGLRDTANGLKQILGSLSFAFTGAAAAQMSAPFVDLDRIDLFVNPRAADSLIDILSKKIGVGPELRVIYPYDIGVFMYAELQDGVPVVSDVQAYLDLFARAGRDLKQAEYLLDKVIRPRWEKA